MADDLIIRGVQAGANLANMAEQRRMRQMELQSQIALRQVQERHLAAQAEMLTEHAALYREQQDTAEQKLKDRQAFLAAGQDLYNQNLANTMDPDDPSDHGDSDEAMKRTANVLAFKDPELAASLLAAHAKVKAPEARVQAAQIGADARTTSAETAADSRRDVASTNADSRKSVAGVNATSREKIAAAKAAAGGFSPEVTEKQAIALQKARDAESAAADQLDAAYATGNETEQAEAEKAHSRAKQFLSDLESAQARQHPDRESGSELSLLTTEFRAAVKAKNEGDKKAAADVERLRNEIRTVRAKKGAAGTQEKVRVKDKSGRTGWIPRSQLDEALKPENGFQVVPEQSNVIQPLPQ